MTEKQKKLINKLLDKYEHSRTYQGTNTRKQSFGVNPGDIYPEYIDPLTDVDLVYDIEQEIKQLEKLLAVKVITKNHSITKVMLDVDNVSVCYGLVSRKEANDISTSMIEFFREWDKRNIPPVSISARKQIERINTGHQISFPIEEFENVYKLIEFMVNNIERDYLLREVSIELFSDSKMIDDTFIKRVCNILEEDGCVDEDILSVEDASERKKLIFETYGVYFNESLIRIKGNAVIHLSDGRMWELKGESFVLTDSTYRIIDKIVVRDSNIITVENLTSYNRISAEDSFFIYLGGYHSKSKQLFIRSLAKFNDSKSWKHFGDIDPHGFYILKNLSDKTGICFEPWLMSVDVLQKYRKYTKPLGNNDIKKAEDAVSNDIYSEIMTYMLENNIKLEQEIVSYYFK